jgi:hypothetical protein
MFDDFDGDELHRAVVSACGLDSRVNAAIPSGARQEGRGGERTQLHVVFAGTSRESLRSNRKQIQNPITIGGGAWLGSS